MALNARQQKFVAGVLAGKPARTAYREAGYNAKTDRAADVAASRLLTNVEVQAAVDAANGRAMERAELTAEWVIDRIREEATRRGKGSSHAARVRALELLGKRFRLFPNTHELSGPHGTPIPLDLTRLTDAQLADLDRLLAAAEPAAAAAGGGAGGDGPAAAAGVRPPGVAGAEPGPEA